MAAPPPPPPPPPAPGPIAKPNNAKLLDSIRSGTGLKKVPESAKNDRSAATTGVDKKSGGTASPIQLPPGSRAPGGAPMSIADAIKARTTKAGQAAAGVAPPKRCDVPPPNQNVAPITTIPKPPDSSSKPAQSSADIKVFPPPPPPMTSGAASKPFAPPPMLPNTNRPLAPPPMPQGSIGKPLAPPPMANMNAGKPIPPPPMSMDTVDKPFAPPPSINKPLAPTSMPINLSNIPPPPPPTNMKLSLPPPVFYSMKPATQEFVQPVNGSSRNTPPMFAPPPPPPSFKPIQPNLPAKAPPVRPPQINAEVSAIKPPLPNRSEVQSAFDSKFTFVDESLFPEPDTIKKRTRGVN